MMKTDGLQGAYTSLARLISRTQALEAPADAPEPARASEVGALGATEGGAGVGG